MENMKPSLKWAADLHAILAQELLARLTAGACKTCGRSGASHQELTAARQFLSDNGITEALRPGTPLKRITDALPFIDPNPEKRTG